MKNNSKLATAVIVAVCALGSASTAMAAFTNPPSKVPETASTVALLGMALFGIEVARRKLKK